MSPAALDTAWYLVINRFARATPALPGALAADALRAGPLLVANGHTASARSGG